MNQLVWAMVKIYMDISMKMIFGRHKLSFRVMWVDALNQLKALIEKSLTPSKQEKNSTTRVTLDLALQHFPKRPDFWSTWLIGWFGLEKFLHMYELITQSKYIFFSPCLSFCMCVFAISDGWIGIWTMLIKTLGRGERKIQGVGYFQNLNAQIELW